MTLNFSLIPIEALARQGTQDVEEWAKKSQQCYHTTRSFAKETESCSGIGTLIFPSICLYSWRTGSIIPTDTGLIEEVVPHSQSCSTPEAISSSHFRNEFSTAGGSPWRTSSVGFRFRISPGM